MFLKTMLKVMLEMFALAGVVLAFVVAFLHG